MCAQSTPPPVAELPAAIPTSPFAFVVKRERPFSRIPITIASTPSESGVTASMRASDCRSEDLLNAHTTQDAWRVVCTKQRYCQKAAKS
eukprot:scaffold301_cov243-Pinguiococcus_pyrenoidosus.AAC.109